MQARFHERIRHDTRIHPTSGNWSGKPKTNHALVGLHPTRAHVEMVSIHNTNTARSSCTSDAERARPARQTPRRHRSERPARRPQQAGRRSGLHTHTARHGAATSGFASAFWQAAQEVLRVSLRQPCRVESSRGRPDCLCPRVSTLCSAADELREESAMKGPSVASPRARHRRRS